MAIEIDLTKAQTDALRAREEGTAQEICQRICAGVADHYIEEAPKVRANVVKAKFERAPEADKAKVEADLKDVADVEPAPVEIERIR
jgi:hypothetical protein